MLSAAVLGGCQSTPDVSAVEPSDIQSALTACSSDRVSVGLARLDSLDAAHPANADVLAIRGLCRSVRFAADSVQADARAALADLSVAAELLEATPDAYQTPVDQVYSQRAFVVQALRPGDWAASLADFDRAVAAAPRNPIHVLDRGVARAMARDTAGARADLRQFIALAPTESARAAELRRLLGERPDSAFTLPLAP
ncbi:MAG TPA: tetratricopeptide repeat protein [Rubricoccaceae bacterium]|jgi:Flp pilus assembly protein TadD